MIVGSVTPITGYPASAEVTMQVPSSVVSSDSGNRPRLRGGKLQMRGQRHYRTSRSYLTSE